MSISYHLKALLADANMTQKELAEATGIRPPTISSICLGTIKQFPVGALDKICEVLHCQPGDILEYIPDDQNKPQADAETDALRAALLNQIKGL
jgi:putative transcriptional regulator